MWKPWIFTVVLAGCASTPAELPPPQVPRPTPEADFFAAWRVWAQQR